MALNHGSSRPEAVAGESCPKRPFAPTAPADQGAYRAASCRPIATDANLLTYAPEYLDIGVPVWCTERQTCNGHRRVVVAHFHTDSGGCGVEFNSRFLTLNYLARVTVVGLRYFPIRSIIK